MDKSTSKYLFSNDILRKVSAQRCYKPMYDSHWVVCSWGNQHLRQKTLRHKQEDTTHGLSGVHEVFTLLEMCCWTELSLGMKCSLSVLNYMAAISYIRLWALETRLVQTKELNFEIYLILTNTDNHLWLVVTVLDKEGSQTMKLTHSMRLLAVGVTGWWQSQSYSKFHMWIHSTAGNRSPKTAATSLPG